jgi:hypothetical protein
MRGDYFEQADIFSDVRAEQRIAKDHPLRGIRRMVDDALKAISPHFDSSCARGSL